MSKKLEIKNCFTTEENGNFIVKFKDEIEQELKVNLSDRIREFLNLDNINFKIGKGRKGGGAGRKPSFKYMCACGKIIKSSDDDLAIRCKKCNSDFEKQE